MNTETKYIYKIENPHALVNIFGANYKNLKAISDYFQREFLVSNDAIVTKAFSEQEKVIFTQMFNSLFKVGSNIVLSKRDLTYCANLAEKDDLDNFEKLYKNTKPIGYTAKGKKLFPKTYSQLIYFEALNKYDLVFSTGPAGTGKTFIAVAYALNELKAENVKKIIITRPVVEAGENLGFLPGDLKEKIDPYLTPIYDILYDILGREKTISYIEKGLIEIAPLAYMRGRTLEDAVVILDEAQNTTCSQMKMFLTRLGFNSKIAITGDISQIDLPTKVQSGLVQAKQLLSDISDIHFIEFEPMDVVRHPLVMKIVDRYEKNAR